MLTNTHAYLHQIKGTSFMSLVQSQNCQILYQLVEMFVQDGSIHEKIHSRDADGFTPLHKACVRGVPEVVELLLAHGADPEVANAGGETAAHLAARRGNPAVLDVLQRRGARLEQLDGKGQTIVHNAVAGDAVLVLLWIERATNISFKSKDASGVTPFHLSCILGKTNCIKFFLRKSRGDVLEKTTTRDNCLHLLLKHRRLECIPLILFSSPRKSSIFNFDQSWKEEKSLILTSKNSDNKTPIELFNDLPSDFKDSNRNFYFLFSMLQFSSVNQLMINFVTYRIFLFLFPFLFFGIGILLSVFLWPNYRMVIFPIVSILTNCFIRTQSHRVGKLDTHQNPIFAGAFLAGIFHDLLCFRVNIYPFITTQWETVLTLIILPIFTVCYLRLVFTDPGKLRISEVETDDFPTFLSNEISKSKMTTQSPMGCVLPLDKFCQVCEVSSFLARVKHCKLCNFCVVNIDHHCLFLMNCIARNNIRNFLFLLTLTLGLITLFLVASTKMIITQCGSMSGASPLPYLYCAYSHETWISMGIIFNVISFIWGVIMLFSQCQAISLSSTYYYRVQQQKRPPLKLKMFKLFYFLVTGRYYISPEEKRVLENV